ncbi:MAG: hypothetical protein K0S79_137 [Nitrospira sp.]|nr:hypothetical protein [Nitrospira sp.]
MREALAFLAAQQVASRHLHVVEKKFGGVQRLLAQLVQQRAAPEAVQALGFRHQQRHALGATGGIGLDGHAHQVGVHAVGDECLGAADVIALAVAPGLGLDALQVGAGAWFAHRDRSHQLAGGHARQPSALLLFAAIGQDVMRHDAAVHVVAEAHGHRGHLLLADHGFVQEVSAAASVFLRDTGAQQAGRARLGPYLAVGMVLLAPTCFVGHAFALEEAPRAVAQHLQIFVHPRSCGSHGLPPPQTSTWPLT